ncbi:MAG: sensor histidine kinase [Betaproteobacteria bacterium]
MNSIRRRLLVALLGALLVAGIAGAGATFLSARGEVGRLLDEELRQVALSLRDHSRLDVARLESRTNDPELRVLVQIWDPAFDRPYSSRIATPLPRQKDEGYTTLEHDGRAWRIYTTFSAKQTIQVAQPTALRTELAALTAARLLLPVLLILPLLGILGWWLVGRGLAPLAALADALARRAPASLEPMPVLESPEEVQPLVRSLNDLLVRLGDAFDTQRRFAADAAHELRTPLTALTLQIQIARRAESPEERAVALDRLEQGVKRATRLVQQLLTMARLDPDAARPTTAFDLAAVAASVIDEKKPFAEQQGLSLALASVPAVLCGQEDALRILVANLVDNALRYTPPGGAVDVRVAPDGDGVRIEVADSGPGIPEEERERVFDRFYRGRQAPSGGSGLGLAIVRQVVTLHGGTITLDASPSGGLLVSARFPANPLLATGSAKASA